MKSERVAVGGHEITKRQRYREIVAVLARHGFGVVDDRMLKHETKEQARAEHLRLACEELGTLFIKLGQVLSTRADILPPAYRAELAKMQERRPAAAHELIAEVIEPCPSRPRRDHRPVTAGTTRLVEQSMSAPVKPPAGADTNWLPSPPPPRSTRGEARSPINALEADQPGDPGVTVPHQMDPDLDDVDAPRRAADPQSKRTDSATWRALTYGAQSP